MRVMTSLAKIKSFHPCKSGWINILRAKAGVHEAAEFPLSDALKSNSISDVLWYLGKSKEGRLEVIMPFADACVVRAREYVAAAAAADVATAAADVAAYAADVATAATAAAYAADVAAAAYVAAAYAAERAEQKAHLKQLLS